MADVFVSYKSDDRPSAERVIAAVQTAGYTTWWDEDITTREAWDAEIEREIAEARAVLVLWTPRSVASEWVRAEAHYAKEHGKLVPAKLAPCGLPLAFRLTQTADLCDWGGAAEHAQWRRMMSWLASLVGRDPETSPRPPGQAQANTRDHQADGVEIWIREPTDLSHPYYGLNEFARGWVEEAFSSIHGIWPGDNNLSAYDLGPDALTREAVEAIASYCAAFENEASDLLSQAYERTLPNGETYSGYNAGGDLCWSTIEGEGFGFSDRKELEAEGLGTRLSAAANKHGARCVYAGCDDRVHFGEV